jgi:hypothetical protein
MLTERVAALVADQVDLDEPRHGVIPFRPRPDRDRILQHRPGLGVRRDRPRTSSLARSGASRRSIVAGDIASNASWVSSVITSCWKRRSLGNQFGHDRGQPLLRRGAQHRPAERQRGNDFRAIDRAPRRPAVAPAWASAPA